MPWHRPDGTVKRLLHDARTILRDELDGGAVSGFPRQDIPPLEPPSGEFDVVLRRAHERRSATSRASRSRWPTVLVAGLAGGLALDQPMATVPDALRAAGNQIGLRPVRRERRAPGLRTPPRARRRSPAPAAAAPADRGADRSRPTTAGTATCVVAGKAVGVAGQPASGLFVYPGEPGAEGFVPADRATADRTAEDGTFSFPARGRRCCWPRGGSAARARRPTAAAIVGRHVRRRR